MTIIDRPTTETNLTVGSRLEGNFESRKEFGAWLDKLNSAIRPPRRKNRKERRSGR